MTTTYNCKDIRFADIQMLRYRLDGFEQLTLRQQLYIYYLAKAAQCGRDITTDQFGAYNLDIRNCLEAIYTHYNGDRHADSFKALTDYLYRVWFANGIYHHYSCDKFVPGFDESYFRFALESVAGRMPHNELPSAERLEQMCRVMFDPDVLPKKVNKTDGEDLVLTSACNYYESLTQSEVERFYAAMRQKDDPTPPSYGLNSTLRRNPLTGQPEEVRWMLGGKYGHHIRDIVKNLEKASQYAENSRQKEVIAQLVKYYTSGDPRDFDTYSIQWLKEQEGMVDFINGFIEVYSDPLGIKGSWEGLVTYRDVEASRRTRTISDNAQWFEDHSPVDPRFRKPQVVGVVANVVCAAMLGGDEYPSTAIGINLPNADWMRAAHGSKSITIGNITRAYSLASHGNGFLEEFVSDDATLRLVNLYGDLCDDLHTDLHECLGHGSGRLMPGVAYDALGAYADTIEEARADLFALYYLADPKLVELGLVPSEQAYESHYYTYMMNGLLTQLTRISLGSGIQEAHMRNRALIARWVHDRYPQAVQLVTRNGKTYVVVADYALLREAFAVLLAEIQRVKSEGDYEAARALVERYAVDVDRKLHEEILARYSSLDIAPYKGFINPKLTLRHDTDGMVIGVDVDYTEPYDVQMMRYSEQSK